MPSAKSLGWEETFHYMPRCRGSVLIWTTRCVNGSVWGRASTLCSGSKDVHPSDVGMVSTTRGLRIQEWGVLPYAVGFNLTLFPNTCKWHRLPGWGNGTASNTLFWMSCPLQFPPNLGLKWPVPSSGQALAMEIVGFRQTMHPRNKVRQANSWPSSMWCPFGLNGKR